MALTDPRQRRLDITVADLNHARDRVFHEFRLREIHEALMTAHRLAGVVGDREQDDVDRMGRKVLEEIRRVTSEFLDYYDAWHSRARSEDAELYDSASESSPSET